MLPAYLLSQKTIRELTRGQLLFSHGDQADHLYLVERGWIKLFRTTTDGRETVMGLCTAGDCFGEASLVRQGLYPYSAEAAADTRIACISRAVLSESMIHDPELAVILLGRLHDRMRQHQRLLDQMQSLNAAQRIGCFLLRLCDLSGHADISADLILPIDKQLVAASLSMKPETFSRALQQLKVQGVEVHGEHIHIDSMAQLQHFVCDICSESGFCSNEAPRMAKTATL